jgi:hypothetical protein
MSTTHSYRARATALALTTASALASISGCGERAPAWDAPIGAIQVQGLRNAAILLDGNLNRALVLRAGVDQQLTIDAVPIGKHVATTAASPDGSRVFVLSQGEPTRLSAADEGPSLTVIDAARPEAPKRYELPDALTALAVDPAGKFAIVYAGDETGGSFIKNPNELIFVDLEANPKPQENPFLHTLPSNVGGSPKRLTFTQPLHFAAGDPRRLLVVETDRDVMLVELDDPSRPEISLPVSDPRTDARALVPAGIAVDPGDPLAPLDKPPVIAIRTATDDNVLIYTLRPSEGHPGDFVPTPNLAFVQGVPSDIAFVHTNQGSRLAALVQSPAPKGLLIKVDDNQTLAAKLGAPYRQMALVTGAVSGGSAGGDQVLLYANTGNVSSVAIWDLGKVPDAAYEDIDSLKSIETLNLGASVGSVVSVNDPAIKVLMTGSQSIYVLDLDRHKASPLDTAGSVSLRFSLEGDRAWAFLPGTPNLAQIGLGGPDVVPVVIDRPIDDVLEIARSDGGKSLLAFHGLASSGSGSARPSRGGVGLTVFDANRPDAATSRRYSSVMLERLSP